jgi:hypothetical protein
MLWIDNPVCICHIDNATQHHLLIKNTLGRHRLQLHWRCKWVRDKNVVFMRPFVIIPVWMLLYCCLHVCLVM